VGQESLDNNFNQAFHYVCHPQDLLFSGFPEEEL
jgi:hypothetical protein